MPLGESSVDRAAQRSLDLAKDPVRARIGDAMSSVQSLWRQIRITDRQEQGGFDIAIQPDAQDLPSIEVAVPQIGINTARIRNVLITPPLSIDPTDRKLLKVRYDERQRTVVRESVIITGEAQTALQTALRFEAMLPEDRSTDWEFFAVDARGNKTKVLDIAPNAELELEIANAKTRRTGISLHVPPRYPNAFWGDSDFLTGVRLFEQVGDGRREFGITVESGVLAAFVQAKERGTALHRDRNGIPTIMDTDYSAADSNLASVKLTPLFRQTNQWSVTVDKVGGGVFPQVSGVVNFSTGDVSYEVRN